MALDFVGSICNTAHMATLNEVIAQLIRLRDSGAGELEVINDSDAVWYGAEENHDDGDVVLFMWQP